ncbi:MAG: putative OB-fold protein [Candidatus Azotimanducaceae bacterium]|jgi:uncharacterized OB-fold protein
MSEVKKVATRPLPKAEEFDTKAFWAGTKDKEFRYQQCTNCDTVIFYPRRHCTGCTNGKLEWKVASGNATVYSYSVVRQSYHPFFRNLVPYVVAWIDLDEGPRILSNVMNVAADDVQIGMKLKLEWEEHEELNIPLFSPA